MIHLGENPFLLETNHFQTELRVYERKTKSQKFPSLCRMMANVSSPLRSNTYKLSPEKKSFVKEILFESMNTNRYVHTHKIKKDLSVEISRDDGVLSYLNWENLE